MWVCCIFSCYLTASVPNSRFWGCNCCKVRNLWWKHVKIDRMYTYILEMCWSEFWESHLILLFTYPHTPIKLCQSNTVVSCMWMKRILRDIVPPPASYSNNGWSSSSHSRLRCSEPNTYTHNSSAPRDSLIAKQHFVCQQNGLRSYLKCSWLIREGPHITHVQRIRGDKIILLLWGCVKDKVLHIVGAWLIAQLTELLLLCS